MNISFRRKVYLEAGQKKNGSPRKSNFNNLSAFLIIISIAFFVIGTEFKEGSLESILISRVDNIIGILFILEYLIRLWVAPLSKRFGKGIKGYLKFIFHPSSIIDLVAISPVFLGFIGSEMYLIRIIRLARIFRLGKVGKFKNAFAHIIFALSIRIEELKIVGLYTSALTLLSSAFLYLAESKVQPEAFGSIPKAMWWSIITITTVGYGDTYPITTFGRIITALTALAGISVIAIAAGLIASGFDEAIKQSKKSKNSNKKIYLGK